MEIKKKELTDIDRKTCGINYTAYKRKQIKKIAIHFLIIAILIISYSLSILNVYQNNVRDTASVIFVTLPFFIAIILNAISIYMYYRPIYIIKQLIKAEEYEICENEGKYYVHILDTLVYLNDRGKLQGDYKINVIRKEV